MRKRSRCGCRCCVGNRILISCQESRCTALMNADTGKRGRKYKCQQGLSHKTRSVITSRRSLAIRVSGPEWPRPRSRRDTGVGALKSRLLVGVGVAVAVGVALGVTVEVALGVVAVGVAVAGLRLLLAYL